VDRYGVAAGAGGGAGGVALAMVLWLQPATNNSPARSGYIKGRTRLCDMAILLQVNFVWNGL
jgi:hypothetical protein